ncbi:glutaminase A [Rivularia sp. UHCC 0363]|uniref:glutaminase A n=1 Tax=Rivularia sp. UHCC 0363 TaxID=3110244 RepID=UPI002B217FB3|nr:glutaminase A [Rivularia sp. UHCC 0363]MEA5597950.1 glutaminase A [Rivularia sp. UHCC 0363]
MSDFPEFIKFLYEEYRHLNSGSLASYIPELTKADPNWFAISIVTKEGEIFEIGDHLQNFTIQSISKVFVYGMALEDCDRETLLEKIGVEPTGDPFNSVIRLDENSKRPDNPMVNAGAIATAGLIKGSNATEKLNRMLDMFRRYIGHDVFIDAPVFMSERATGHRNRALANLLLNFDIIENNIEEILDFYFQQCALVVNCHDLAVMAATLANRGINPIAKKQAVKPCYVRDILSVMYTCGMYNYAGEWAYRVGIPAKSGVSGGIIGVIPDRAGIAVFSPLIDSRGNSVRGIKVFEALSDQFNLHLFDSPLPKCSFLDISKNSEELISKPLKVTFDKSKSL